MDITLHLAGVQDAERIYEMQLEAFSHLLSRYLDYETSPAAEPLQKTTQRLAEAFTDYYLICAGGSPVGAARVRRVGDTACRLGPVFVPVSYTHLTLPTT